MLIDRSTPIFRNDDVRFPDPLPARYVVTGWGSCMVPILPEGRVVGLFDTGAEIAAGDFATVWIRDDWGRVNGLLKFISKWDGSDLEMKCLNPPRAGWLTSSDRLVAIHRLVCVCGEDRQTIAHDELVMRWHAVRAGGQRPNC